MIKKQKATNKNNYKHIQILNYFTYIVINQIFKKYKMLVL